MVWVHIHTEDNTAPDPSTLKILGEVCLAAVRMIEFDRSAWMRWEDEGGAVAPLRDPNWSFLDKQLREIEVC